MAVHWSAIEPNLHVSLLVDNLAQKCFYIMSGLSALYVAMRLIVSEMYPNSAASRLLSFFSVFSAIPLACQKSSQH